MAAALACTDELDFRRRIEASSFNPHAEDSALRLFPRGRIQRDAGSCARCGAAAYSAARASNADGVPQPPSRLPRFSLDA